MFCGKILVRLEIFKKHIFYLEGNKLEIWKKNLNQDLLQFVEEQM